MPAGASLAPPDRRASEGLPPARYPVSKTGGPQGLGGSTPSPSASAPDKDRAPVTACAARPRQMHAGARARRHGRVVRQRPATAWRIQLRPQVRSLLPPSGRGGTPWFPPEPPPSALRTDRPRWTSRPAKRASGRELDAHRSLFRPVAQRRRAVGFEPTRARSNRAGAVRRGGPRGSPTSPLLLRRARASRSGPPGRDGRATHTHTHTHTPFPHESTAGSSIAQSASLTKRRMEVRVLRRGYALEAQLGRAAAL
jgi:hypothetical protein